MKANVAIFLSDCKTRCLSRGIWESSSQRNSWRNDQVSHTSLPHPPFLWNTSWFCLKRNEREIVPFVNLGKAGVCGGKNGIKQNRTVFLHNTRNCNH